MTRDEPPGRWAVSLAAADRAHVGPLRLETGVEACLAGDELWLRGDALDEKLAHRLRQVLGARRFTVLDDGQLQAVGTVVPKGRLPAGPWRGLAAWLEVELPAVAWPAAAAPPVPLTVVRSDVPDEPSILITSLAQWRAYGETAPQVRLERLAFAVCSAGPFVVLIVGTPLPPLAGQRWVQRDGIATPAGWTWSPPVDPAVVRQLLGLDEGDVALLQPDGSWQRVAAGDFVRATRSAIRGDA